VRGHRRETGKDFFPGGNLSASYEEGMGKNVRNNVTDSGVPAGGEMGKSGAKNRKRTLLRDGNVSGGGKKSDWVGKGGHSERTRIAREHRYIFKQLERGRKRVSRKTTTK